jgi:hypothetical protein
MVWTQKTTNCTITLKSYTASTFFFTGDWFKQLNSNRGIAFCTIKTYVKTIICFNHFAFKVETGAAETCSDLVRKCERQDTWWRPRAFRKLD